MTAALTAPPTTDVDQPFPGMEDDQAAADPAADVLPVMPAAPDPTPYGTTTDGKPRAKPGRKPGQRNGTGQAARKAATAPKTPTAPTARKPAAKPPQRTTQTDYRPGLLGLFGQLTMGAATFGVLKSDPALIADAAAIDSAAPAIADAVNTAADQWPVVAAICDKVLTVGPHASGLIALVGLVGQIGVNHGWMPAGLIPGTMPRDQLAAAYVTKRAAESEEFAAILSFAQRHQQTAGQAAGQPAAA